jgi:PKD repeat protein
MTYKELVNIIRDAANYVNPNGTFVHGRKTDASLNYNEPSPYIFLLEPRPLPQSNNSKYVINISFPIIFVGQDSPESSELEREDLKQEMSILAMQLLSRIDQNDNLENVRFESPEPEIRQMAGTLTGFSFSLALTYNTNDCTINVDLPPSIKLFANETNVVSGTEIELAWIAENVNQVSISGFGVLQGSTGLVNVVVNNTETFVGNATNSAGTESDTITITVGSACLDATAVLKDSANNTISTTDIPSGDTEDIVAPDGNIVLKRANNTILRTVSVRSNQTKDETIANTTVQLRDSANNNIGSSNSYQAESSNNLTAPDGTINIVNTLNTPIQTETVRSNQTKSATIANVSWTDSDGSPQSTPYSEPIACAPQQVLSVDFSANDTTPDTNQTVTFTDLTVGATQWLWDFGDGTTSSLQNPTHTYKYQGTYSVTLCATNGSVSGKEIKTNYIAVTLQSIPTTTLQAWYKAPVGATPSNLTLVSGAISQWNDDSGNGYNLVQGTAVSRPLYSVTEITSPDGTVYGGGTFDGTNDFLSNISAGFTRGTTSTMFMLFKQNSIASGARVVFAAQNGLQGVSALANNPQFRMISGGNIDTLIAYPLMNYFVVKFQFSNAGNASIKINNLIARAIANTGASTDVGIVIGGNIAGTAQSNITFVEGAIYSTALSAPNETSILNYFSSKFGLW